MAKKDIVLQIGCKVEVLNSWFAINQLENTPLVFFLLLKKMFQII